MSTAPDYTPGTSFADDEANNVAGRSLVKTSSLDTEFANVSTSINDINANLQAIQRDDNKLKDGIIEPYALSEQTNALIAVGGTTPRGTWAPNTNYAFKDIIQRDNIAQICLQAHNSGSVFVQSFWLPISGDGTSAANAAAAAASASSASTSASNASTSASTATSAASAASTSATNAATSATNANNSATSSATSATNSSNSASEASASASAAATSAASINSPENTASDPNYTSTSFSKAASPQWVNGANNIKAWVNFNGTGTVAIRASKNVSSITDNGTGDYTINFTTPLANTNFAVIGNAKTTASDTSAIYLTESSQTARTTSAVRVRTINSAASYADSDTVCAGVISN